MAYILLQLPCGPLSSQAQTLQVKLTIFIPILNLNAFNLEEEEEDLVALSSLSDIGQIEVKFGYAVITKENQTVPPIEIPAELKVNEKAKKGIDHQTR